MIFVLSNVLSLQKEEIATSAACSQLTDPSAGLELEREIALCEKKNLEYMRVDPALSGLEKVCAARKQHSRKKGLTNDPGRLAPRSPGGYHFDSDFVSLGCIKYIHTSIYKKNSERILLNVFGLPPSAVSTRRGVSTAGRPPRRFLLQDH